VDGVTHTDSTKAKTCPEQESVDFVTHVGVHNTTEDTRISQNLTVEKHHHRS
jgi:hypothetical protein